MSKEGKEIFTTSTGRLRWKEISNDGKEYWRYSLRDKDNKVNSKENFIIADDKRPYMHSKTDPNYLAYHSRKMKLRSEYPNWMKMSREQWLEYYTKVIELTKSVDKSKKKNSVPKWISIPHSLMICVLSFSV